MSIFVRQILKLIMKKIKLLFAFTVLAITSANSQAIFSEDFNGTTPLSTWTLHNVDARTPAANVGAINDAWVVLGVGGQPAALSTSWYSPAGAADDYMVTPAITLTSNNYLFFDAQALDASFPDGYEVRLSTTNSTVAALSTVLLNVPAETATVWNSRRIDLSAYANQTVHVAWRNNSNDQFVLAVDNIEIKEVISNDAGVEDLTISDTYVTNSTVTIAGTIENTGLNTLNTVDINWSTDGGVTVNSNSLTPSTASFGSASFTHTITATALNPGSFTDLMVWTSNPNGVADSLNANDTIRTQFFVNNGTTVSREVLLEEFTTAPCQFCPDGAVIVEQILASNPAVIAVGEHACFGTDAMTIPEASTYCAAFGSGAPTACIDRVLFPGEASVAHGRGTWAANASARAAIGSPVTVNITGSYNGATRQVNADVTANFADYAVPGDIRVTLFVVEDSITGTGSGYNQVNFYNNQAGHPYVGAGNPIVGFVHRHVLRDVYPTTDAWGDATIIPSSPALNTNYTQSNTFTLNSAWKDQDVSLVAFVSYFNSNTDERVVLNAAEVKLNNISTSIEVIKTDGGSFSIYPNPAADLSTIEFNLSTSKNVMLNMRDIAGKEVLSENFGILSSGNHKITVNTANLSNGVYFATFLLGEEVITKKISVNK